MASDRTKTLKYVVETEKTDLKNKKKRRDDLQKAIKEMESSRYANHAEDINKFAANVKRAVQSGITGSATADMNACSLDSIRELSIHGDARLNNAYLVLQREFSKSEREIADKETDLTRHENEYKESKEQDLKDFFGFG